MKKLFAVIGGLIWAIIIGLIIYLFGSSTDFYIQSVSVFYILPIFAIVIGGVASAGLYFCYKLLKIQPNNSVLIWTLGNSLVVAVTIYQLFAYRAAAESLIAFLNDYLTNQQTTIFYRTAVNSVTFDSGYVLNSISLGIEFIGYFIGGFIAYILISSRKYCATCEEYFKVKQLKTYLNLTPDTICGVLEKESDIAKAFSIIDQKASHVETIGLRKLHTSLNFHYCPICFNSELELKSEEFDTTSNKSTGSESRQINLRREGGRQLYTLISYLKNH